MTQENEASTLIRHLDEFVPVLPEPCIGRESILDTLDGMFEEGNDLIVLEGPEGRGKTVLASLFARRHITSAFAVFLKTGSKYAYDPVLVCTDLSQQIAFAIGKTVPSDGYDSQRHYSSLVYDLRKWLKRRKEGVFFILDGVYEIPAVEQAYARQIWDLLPFDLEGCKFLITRVPKPDFALPLPKQFKEMPLPVFGPEESVRYLEDTSLDRATLDQVHSTWRGEPGSLAAVRRVVRSGVDRSRLFEEISRMHPQLFELEWEAVSDLSPDAKLAIAVIANDPRRLTSADLARLLRVGKEVLDRCLPSLTFLVVEPETGCVTFVSEPFRRFALDRLCDLRKKVDDLVIDDLLSRRTLDSEETVLPEYLVRAGRYNELLQLLTPDNFETTILHCQSLAPVKQQVDFGVRASLALNRDKELVRFSIHKSALLQLEGTDIEKAEIEARIALGDSEGALSLANAAGLRENRLHLLAVIAKSKVRSGHPVEPELIDSIHSLYRQIDKDHLGRRALEIASDLVHCAPSLALELTEASSRSDTADAKEAALASLALEASRIHRPGDQEDYAREIRERILSPELRKFIDEASIRIIDTSAKDVLSQVQTLTPSARALFFLRRWAVKNRRRSDAHEVVAFALSLAIRSSEYTPTAKDMRELSSPLPFLEDCTESQKLVYSFDSNKENVRAYGPTVDFARLQLNLARAEFRFERPRGRHRFEEVFYYALGVKDVGVKAECLAWLLVALTLADPGRTLEVSDKMHSSVEDELRCVVHELLRTSALHGTVFSGIVRALALVRLDLALEVSNSLNTQPSRFSALVEALESAVSASDPPCSPSEIRKSLSCISDDEDRDHGLLSILERIRSRREIPQGWHNDLLQLCELVMSVGHADLRCKCIVRFYHLLHRCDKDRFSHQLEAVFKALSDGLDQISVGWDRVRVAFEAATSLAPLSPEHARAVLAFGDGAKATVLLQTSSEANAYVGTILLTISAFIGLLPRKLRDENDIRRLEELINRIPSDGDRARMWSELALRAYAVRDFELCNTVVGDRVRPLLERLRGASKVQAAQTISLIAPALQCAFPMSAYHDFDLLKGSMRDYAYFVTCQFLLRRRTRLEAFISLPNQQFDVSYDNALAIIDLAEKIEEDSCICSVLHDLVNSLCDSKQRGSITRDQRDTLAARLESVAKQKFPSQRYISHDGYVISARALIEKLKASKTPEWDALLSQGRQLPNVSDQIFVLCQIAEACQSRNRFKCLAILEEAYRIAQGLFCVYDRVSRISMIAVQALEVDKGFWRRLLESGMEHSIEAESDEVWPVQREILDFAHRIDPDFASSLVAKADTDKARASTRRSLARRLEVLKATKALSDASSGQNKDASDLTNSYPQAAWRLLGQLNAGRISTRRQEDMREFVRHASTLPFSEAYPILSWVIGNAVTRFANTDQATSVLRPMFEATLIASQIAARVAEQNNRFLNEVWLPTSTCGEEGRGGLVRAGERDHAIGRIRQWMERYVRDYLWISDPYFGLDDLELLKIILDIRPSIRVCIVTSRIHQIDKSVAEPYKGTYTDYWRAHCSEQDPPNTTILIVGTEKTHSSPVHDRWWLTDGAGLEMGTSFRSLGVGKDAKLSELPKASVESFAAVLSQYVRMEKLEHMGEKLSYEVFTL